MEFLTTEIAIGIALFRHCGQQAIQKNTSMLYLKVFLSFAEIVCKFLPFSRQELIMAAKFH
jgi:hypothetical protein